jgi:hypothetical protein
MKGIRTILAFILTMLLASIAFSGEQITLQKAQGEVTVRAGVTETWKKATAGEALNPDATLKTGKQSSALIVLSSNSKKISLPPEVMVDISDIRELTQEELMLKLTMEKVRSSSYEWKNKEMNIPNTTVVHGPPKDQKVALVETNSEDGILQMNGTRVLYENGFYPTSALKALDVMRRYPTLGGKFENRLLVAQALEKSNLKSEALNAYVNLSLALDITKEQREALQSKIALLRKP